jgi:hypothetical protein
LSVTLNAASGTFGGSFDNPSTGKPIHFQGGLMPGANSGFGYFTESNHSGAVIMGNFPLLPFLP